MGFFSAVTNLFRRAPKDGERESAEVRTAPVTEGKQPADPASEPERSEGGTSPEPFTPPSASKPAMSVSSPSAPMSEPALSPVAPDSGRDAPPVAPVVPPVAAPSATVPPPVAANAEEEKLTLALRAAEPRLSAWLAVVLDGVEEASDPLWRRLDFLLRALETPPDEARAFLEDFRSWLARMEYQYLEDFRSELQYRLALALDMEDEEDERDRLFLKLQNGLARTRARFGQGLSALLAGHAGLTPAFWEEMEELFIMADMGAEPSLRLVRKLQARAQQSGVSAPDGLLPLLEDEVTALFHAPRRIAAFNPPEVVLMVGVNGVGKTTTIAKLAYRARMQGKKVLIAAADTFRAAAVEQLEVWAGRVGADFHAKGMGADPAAVAFEAMDMAVAGHYDILFVDTAGRLHTKSNLMEELHKIRAVLGRKHAGAPHRTILVIDATTGQNALQQTKIFRESSGVDEIILTKLDGTAKGGVALAVASQFGLPITFIGLGEKMEDLRPFNPSDFARALLAREEERSDS